MRRLTGFQIAVIILLALILLVVAGVITFNG